MKNKLGLEGFIQVALVVENIEQVAKKWSEIFGIPTPEIEIHGPSEDQTLLYHGELADYKIKFAAIEVPNKGVVIELTEPIEGKSTFKDFFDKHGQGVHHLGFEVGDRRDAIVGELEKEKGYDLRTVGYYPGSSWTIVDTEEALGVNLNIKPMA